MRENGLDSDGRDFLLPFRVAAILDPNQQFYQLHLVQDLSFLRGKTISAVGTDNVGIWSQVVSEPQESSHPIAWNLAVCI